jgi:transposase
VCSCGAGGRSSARLDQIKTKERDAERLVRLSMIDALHAVRVPVAEEEALRDLVRAREDVRGDLMRAANPCLSRCCATMCATRTRPAAGAELCRAWLAKIDFGRR